jgi:hypothetical protein
LLSFAQCGRGMAIKTNRRPKKKKVFLIKMLKINEPRHLLLRRRGNNKHQLRNIFLCFVSKFNEERKIKNRKKSHKFVASSPSSSLD